MNWPPVHHHEADVAALHDDDGNLSVYTCATCYALVSGYRLDEHKAWHEELHALINLAAQGIQIKFDTEET